MMIQKVKKKKKKKKSVALCWNRTYQVWLEQCLTIRQLHTADLVHSKFSFIGYLGHNLEIVLRILRILKLRTTVALSRD